MTYEALRYVQLRGPQWPDGTPLWKIPLWEIQVSAPKLKKLKGAADLMSAANQLEDRIFPLRMLQTDPLASQGKPDELFRRPHVVSMHVLAGHGQAPYEPGFDKANGNYQDPLYAERGYPKGFEEYRGKHPNDAVFVTELETAAESLMLAGPVDARLPRERKVFSQLRWRRRWTPDRDMPPYWYTLRVPPDGSLPTQDMGERVDAQFQHVIAEPVLAAEETWPPKDDEAIRLPPFGLLAGAVSLAVAHGALPWLGDLEPEAPPARGPLQITRYPVRLVPDGIELRTSVDFLGKGPLEGWFHIGIDKDALMLTLLVGRTGEAGLLTPWRKAWAAAVPAAGTEESLQGFRVATDVASVPAFRWRIPDLAGDLPDPADHAKGNNTTPGPKIKANFAKVPVEVPARSVRVDLLSPASAGSVDGVVNIGGGYFRLGTRDTMKAAMFRDKTADADFTPWATAAPPDSLILAWSSPEPPNAPKSHWMIEATGRTSSAALLPREGSYECAHNARRLASDLRGAYGLPDPVAPADGETGEAPQRPMLPAFVPLRDGWLQVQVPNVPPYDPTKDVADLSLLAAPQENILSGFLRFGNSGQLPPIYSAFEALPAQMVTEAPWQVTVEGAQRLRVAVEIGVRPIVGPDGGKRATPVMPQAGKAMADNPALSMRGLLWFSSDHPDALEAIPRLGAGPGAFIDVPLERMDNEARDPNERYVAITLKSLELGVDGGKVTREKLSLSMALNKPSAADQVVRWQRHPSMPLAALMPLTRSARSAVRPLESRDLVPFKASRTANGTLMPLADLTWNARESLPRMDEGWTFALVEQLVNSGLPPPEQPQPPDESHRCRLAWAAFGVPGYEVVPLGGGDPSADGKKGQWTIHAAPRFDLPANDEAFATATLPASMQSPADQAAQLAQPVVTALDWTALTTFWAEQQRLLQLSRVAHSYLAGFKAEGNIDPTVVDSLVGHLQWNLGALGFTAPAAPSRLPYGTMSIGDKTWSGNRALIGFSGRFSVTADGSLKPEEAAAKQHIEVLGYSPGSFLEGDFLHDARRVGTAQQLSLHEGQSRWRAISSHAMGSRVKGVFNVRNPIAVTAGPSSLALWFKDLPLDKDGKYIAEAGQLSAAAWQDGQLEMRGVEWRFMATGDDEGFAMGDDTFGFFGLRMRPLGLESLVVEMSGGRPSSPTPLTATLVAELSLGPRKEDVNDGSNLVKIAMVRSGNALAIESIALFDGNGLSFPIWLSGGNTAEAVREANLEVTVGQVAWDKVKGELVLGSVELGFGFLGSRVTLTGVTPSRDGAALVFDWTKVNPAAGWLAVQRARLRVGAEAAFRFAHALHLAPGSPQQGAGPISVDTVQKWGADGSARAVWPAELLAGCKVKVLGVSAPAKFHSGPCAFVVVSDPGKEPLEPLLPGFPFEGTFNFGLVATAAPFVNERAEVASGSLSGSIVWADDANKDHTLQLKSIHFEASSRLRDEITFQGWQGRLVLNGDIAGTSAIAWPGVDLSTGSGLPMPPVATTITLVQFDHSVWYRHEVNWLLRNHELSFRTAAGLKERYDAVWSAPALAQHTIFSVAVGSGEVREVLAFSSVDTLTLAPMRVFAPPWPAGGHAADLQASSTFAARYMTGNSGGHDPGMAWPGRGGLGTVLQGFSGALFRQAFYASDSHTDGKDLVITGGFAGLVTIPGEDAAPLLRLPALVALEGSLRVTAGKEPPIRQNAHSRVNVAWADGVSAQDVVAPWRSAMTTVAASQQDVEQAIDAGTRRPPPSDASPQRLFNAILVEQCFPVELDSQGKLEGIPYFIAASVSVARAIAHVASVRNPQDAALELTSLSVLSRVSLTHGSGKAYRQGAAAVLRTSHGQTTGSALPPPPGLLMIVGDDLTHTPWLAPSPDDAQDADGRMAAIASELHKRPRQALVRDADGRHTAIRLPQRLLSPRERRVPTLRYTDVARGYMLAPDTSMLMAGGEEGWTGAVRDAASGISAMGRVAAWPAQAQRETGGAHAVWLTQQRVPVYLPLRSTALSTPIGWLDPGSARTRIPLGTEVDNALARAVGRAEDPDQEDPAGLKHSALWQGVVPGQTSTTSVSDRAGVLIARRLRLEIAAPRKDGQPYVFDAAFPRFGEPAQSSSSHARTERTPRPGILPENSEHADPAVHRRPCVSPLQSGINNRAVLGSADIVRGTTHWDTRSAAHKGYVSWVMNFVACPRSCGVISDPWDGTLDFAVEVDAMELGDQADLAAYVLGFVLGADFANGRVLATASMIVNGKEFPFSSVHVREFVPGPIPPVGIKKPRTGVVTLVLDMRNPKDATEGPAPATSVLAAIRNAGPGPATVEVQLTLHPQAQADLPKERPQSKYALGQEQPIPHGSNRAPVTLRMPLFPVTRERGAMPLEPATVLFMDPAYDAGLASQPVEEALRIALPPEPLPHPALPEGRGDMMFVLSADRGRVNRCGTVTFMADLRFERRLPSNVAQLLPPGTGDIEIEQQSDPLKAPLVLEIHLQPRAGERRELYLASRTQGAKPAKTRVKLTEVYELALATLVEEDGSTAQLAAGDVLELAARKAASEGDGIAEGADAMMEVDVLDAAKLGKAGVWATVKFDFHNQNRTLRLTLTDEPVVEPPPGLYAALLRTTDPVTPDGTALSLPLYAQSPLPWRVDLPNARADFRAGLMHRTATFVWSLLRPADERDRLGVFVVKSDRNGQTYLPEEETVDSDFRPFNLLAYDKRPMRSEPASG